VKPSYSFLSVVNPITCVLTNNILSDLKRVNGYFLRYNFKNLLIDKEISLFISKII